MSKSFDVYLHRFCGLSGRDRREIYFSRSSKHKFKPDSLNQPAPHPHSTFNHRNYHLHTLAEIIDPSTRRSSWEATIGWREGKSRFFVVLFKQQSVVYIFSVCSQSVFHFREIVKCELIENEIKHIARRKVQEVIASRPQKVSDFIFSPRRLAVINHESTTDLKSLSALRKSKPGYYLGLAWAV